MSKRPSISIRRGWLYVLIASFLLYALTANRGPQWQDSGEHMLRIMTGQVVHRLGLALSHPLHYGLGRLALSLDLLEPSFAITLISSLAGALAVANLYGCVKTLTNHGPAALFASCSLGLSHTFWQMATRTEVYTLTVALLAAECWVLIAFAKHRKPVLLIAAFFLNGLGVANHMLASLTTPILAAVLLVSWRYKSVRGRDVLSALLVWIVGTLPYSLLILREAMRSGDLSTTVHLALFGQSYVDRVLNLSVSARGLLFTAAFFLLNFPNFLIPAAVHGLYRGRRGVVPVLAYRALFAALIVHAVFASRYNVVDQFTFLIPTYLLLSIFGGLGFSLWASTRGNSGGKIIRLSMIALILTPGWYAIAPNVARKFNVLEGTVPHKPYRDNYVYAFSPWSIADISAKRMSQEALRLVGDRGIILVEENMSSFAIRYEVIRNRDDGVTVSLDILPEQIKQMLASGGRVVLVPADADAPRTRAPLGRWRRVGDLYVLDADAPPS